MSYATVDPGKVRAQRAAASTAVSLERRGLGEVAESRGESAYVIDMGDHYVSTVTEALGTKNLVADAVRPLTGRSHYDDVARDTVATILNDLATVGGHPVALTAYWASGSSEWFSDTARMADLVDGWTAACREAGCSWGGGETQVLTEMIQPAVAVLGGSAVGRIAPKSRLLVGSSVTRGDAILIAPATGIHANGLTLARRIADKLPRGYATPVPGDTRGRSYGEVLLDPAPLYGPVVEALQEASVDLHYAAHVTGHGWRKLMRATGALTYVLDAVPAPPPIFDFMMRAASIEQAEAYGTFNMGAGFAFYVGDGEVERALDVARASGVELLQAGHVEEGPRRVVIRPIGVTFEDAALCIR